MASNSMSPAISGAPLGLSSDDDYPQDVGPQGIEIILEGEESSESADDVKGDFDDNLAETMDERDLNTLSSDLLEAFQQDVASRKEWVEMYIEGMKVLGMKYEERTEPWDGACGVYSAILTEAAIRFQADTITETFPAAGPVKTEIIGAETPEKLDAAERVQEDMNYQITEVMTEFRPEHERMLYNLGLGGAAFKKVYQDTRKDRQTSRFVPAEDIIMPYGVPSAEDSERVTHVMRKTPNEVRALQVGGFYRDVELGEPQKFISDIEEEKAKDEGFSAINDDRYQFLEMHVEIELPGGDPFDPAGDDEDKRLPLPYVVTIERGTGEVLGVRRNWAQDDPTHQKRQHFVQYTYIPGFGVYGMGLIHVVGGYARAGTSIIRQLVDAGTLSNLPGGLKTRGLRTKGDDTPIAPGEFRDVDIPSGTLRDNIMPLPYKEPSQVLLALLQQINDEGRRLGSIADMKASDMNANAPVGTTLALLERQLKTMSAVQARVHFAMKKEFKLLKDLIRDHAPDDYSFDPQTGSRSARKADYDMVDVIPVSDPNSATMTHRIMQYQAVQQLSASAPQIYDLPYLHRQMIEVLGVKNADKIVPGGEEQKPQDPIAENMALLTGKPVKAFVSQDQDAHIAVHSSMLQDPLVMGPIGQNPQAQQIIASIHAHIAEHVAFQYRVKVEQQLGATLPAPGEQLDPSIEAKLAPLVAQAAQQLLAVNQANAAQQKAQQQAQDPIIQMQQQELQIKGQEAQTKAQKVQGDLALKQQELQIKGQTEQQRLAIEAQKVGVMGRAQDQEILAQDRANAAQLQMDVAKHQLEMAKSANEAKAAAMSHIQDLEQQQRQQQLDLVKAQQGHVQSMTHAQQVHEQQLANMKALQAAQPSKPESGE